MKLNFFLLLILLIQGCAKDAPTLKQLPSILNIKMPNSGRLIETSLKLVNTPAIKLSPEQPIEVASVDSKSSLDVLSANSFSLFNLSSDEISSFIISKDGTQAFVGTRNGSVLLLTIIKSEQKNNQEKNLAYEKHLQLQQLLKGARAIDAIALSEDEKYLAISMFSETVIYDLKNNKITNKMSRLNGRVASLAWDPRGEFLAIGRSGGEVSLWQLAKSSFAGTDNLNAIQQYGSGGGTPIEKIIFLPTARAFIAGSRNGDIQLWRILRTEEELGLRDKRAEIDQEQEGNLAKDIASLNAVLEDLILNEDATELIAATSDGKIYRWKLRGLIKISEFSIGDNATSSIELLKVNESKTAFLSAGRGQNLNVWCLNEKFNRVGGFDKISQTTINPLAIPGSINGIKLAESITFEQPINLIRKSPQSFNLWLVQKKGNVMLFNLETLLESSSFLRKVSNCPDLD